ncbi:hypothetical protein H4Q26_004924 [Puccinia striiformis f. sp. tritici PST-130]|nr:hypothetical protein H4Q26_004924 [Puccinia striiformis f. sp. tritici PST-130]
MKLVLKILSKIDATMGKIKLVIACVGPRLVRGDIRHDKDFKNLKIFNCHRIADCIYIINDKVCELLETYRLLIEESGHIFDHQSESVDDVLMRTFTCSFWIDGTIEGMDRWELHHVQDEWRTGLDSINETLAVFYQFVAACSEEHNAHLIRVKEPIFSPQHFGYWNVDDISNNNDSSNQYFKLAFGKAVGDFERYKRLQDEV